MSGRGEPIYLDYQATTPTDPRVLAAMLPWFTEKFGNPHSTSHGYGLAAAEAVERARGEVAALIGGEAREIVFTSGATEANNLAIQGAALFRQRQGLSGKSHVVTAATEHKCVLEATRSLVRLGWRVTILPVEADGLIDLGRLAEAVTPDTALVSIMAVNNEIGVIQPLAEIGALCRSRGALFHTDAAQAAGKIPLDVDRMQIDLLSLSAHKIYGPKGIGALYVRRRPRARIAPLFEGGGQEGGLRSGTLPTPLCVGFGAAAALAAAELPQEAERLAGLRTRLLHDLRQIALDLRLHGHEAQRVAGNLNLAFPGIPAEQLLQACPGLALSTGSACSSAAIEPSYVIRALGLEDEAARGAFRLCLGRFTTEAEVSRAVAELAAALRSLRAHSFQRGVTEAAAAIT
jgi:cysteine desulfurase